MKKNLRKEWAGCSDLETRRGELLKAHEEFLRMQAEGWHVTNARKRRPRINRSETSQVNQRQGKGKPRFIITTVLGGRTKVSIEVFEQRYKPLGFKVVTEIF